MVAAAYTQQGYVAGTLAKLLQPAAPLDDSIVVKYPFAGEDQAAAGRADGNAVAHLAADGRRRSLVQPSHTAVHIAFADQCKPLEGETDHLLVDLAKFPTNLHATLRQFAGRDRIFGPQNSVFR